eukprot:1761578-Pyramimonas_sp.AAC.1
MDPFWRCLTRASSDPVCAAVDRAPLRLRRTGRGLGGGAVHGAPGPGMPADGGPLQPREPPVL